MNNELFIRILSSLILIPVVFFLIYEGSIFFKLFVLVFFLVTLYEWHYLSFNRIYYLPGFIFIFFSFYAFYILRNEGNFSFFLLILLTCISTDIGGYIFGKILKGPKLTKISPNKTYWGMLGSFILSFTTAYVYFYNFAFISISDLDRQMEFKIITIVLSVSLVSQVGDLIISFFKRKLRIKNTGKIIPGHGGILDRIDGMIFAFPYAFLLTKFVL